MPASTPIAAPSSPLSSLRASRASRASREDSADDESKSPRSATKGYRMPRFPRFLSSRKILSPGSTTSSASRSLTGMSPDDARCKSLDDQLLATDDSACGTSVNGGDDCPTFQGIKGWARAIRAAARELTRTGSVAPAHARGEPSHARRRGV